MIVLNQYLLLKSLHIFGDIIPGILLSPLFGKHLQI